MTDDENIGENRAEPTVPKQNSHSVRSFEKRKRTPGAPKYLTTEEITTFFKAITDLRDRALFRVIHHGRLRAHEAGRPQLARWWGASSM